MLLVLEHPHPAVAHRRVGAAREGGCNLPPSAAVASHALLDQRVLFWRPHRPAMVRAFDAGAGFLCGRLCLERDVIW
eukprot:scaffold303267_cov31-Tisochrysis_lutea.AAC.2